MKFCPNCGASLPGSTASFCPECGKKLPRMQREPDTRLRKSRPPAKKQHEPPKRNMPQRPRRNPQDENYDGYYNDVAPVDAGLRGDGVDPELVRRVAILIASALGIIILAIVLMMLL